MLKRLLPPMIGAILMAIPTALLMTNGHRVANPHRLPSSDSTTLAKANPIHPDCVDSPQPRQCSGVVEELTDELARFNAAFNPPNADRLAAFYDEQAVLYVGSAGRFFRGRGEIRNLFFAPLVPTFAGATVDISAFHYQVISPNLVILYGSPSTVLTLNDGSSVTLPPLPQTLTWVRRGGDRNRPFVILTDHE